MDEFIKLVEQMRIAQKMYFRTRNQHFLIDSKKYETQVDEYIRNYRINKTIKPNNGK